MKKVTSGLAKNSTLKIVQVSFTSYFIFISCFEVLASTEKMLQ